MSEIRAPGDLFLTDADADAGSLAFFDFFLPKLNHDVLFNCAAASDFSAYSALLIRSFFTLFISSSEFFISTYNLFIGIFISL